MTQMTGAQMLTGAQILIQSLIDQGCEVLFGYPGGAVLNIYDALYQRRDEIRHILASHEQGAAHAADGYARSTGKTGVVLATSGPGATNLVTGIAAAYHDSVPLVAITGNVSTDLIGRDSFQEIDIVSITKPIVKQNFFVTDGAELPAIIRQAFEIANSGRKRPVLIDIPKDITATKYPFVSQPRFTPQSGFTPQAHSTLPGTPEGQFTLAVQKIDAARQPLIYCGGGVTFSDGASEALRVFSNHIHAPVVCSMMGLSAMPAAAPLNLGLVGMHGTAAANMAVDACDLLIAVGARFSDRVAGNRVLFAKNATVLHIDIDPTEISKNRRADIALICDTGACLRALTEHAAGARHTEWTQKVLHYKANNALPFDKSGDLAVSPREVITCLRRLADDDTIIATDVGQHQMFVAQYYAFARPRTFVSSCGLGAMGYGMGAAIGAAVGNPGKKVVLVTGDGSFHMNLAELAVAVSNRLSIVVLVMNNRVLGMVHQWQQLFYGERYSCTEIDRRTDFVKLAEAFGAKGLRIQCGEQIIPILTEALQTDRPCVVDCTVEPGERVFPIIPPGGVGDDMIYMVDTD